MNLNFTIFRALLLGWNNSPRWLQQLVRALGFTKFVNSIWVPYRDLPIPPTEQPVRALIQKIVQPGWTCADVGANFGMMTEVMAAKTGATGKVAAFEAHPLNTTILRHRMRMKGYEKTVTIENKAVSDGAEKSVWIFPGRRRSPNEWNMMGHDVEGHTTKANFEIPAVALDEYFKNSPLDFVKIDVEGAESKVISGMRQVLREKAPVVIVEFHNANAWESRHELFASGYRLFHLTGEEVLPESSHAGHVCAWPGGKTPSAGLFSARVASSLV